MRIVRDANGQALSYVYFESEPRDFYADYQGSVAVMAENTR